MLSKRKLAKFSSTLFQLTPQQYGAQDFAIMQNRQDILDALYFIDGRDKPGHKLHSTYTGLFQKYFKD